MSHMYGPRGRFSDLLSQIITGQDVSGSELLIVIGMLRERTLREDFLECLHNKAPCLRLPHDSYLCILDITRALLREANNSGDFKSIAAVFSTSRRYGRSTGSSMFSILHSLPSHEVWSNINFWMYCTDEILSDDIIRWEELASKSRRFIGMQSSHVFALFSILRIQAVAFGSMRAVGASTSTIRRYIETAAETYGLQAAGVDLSRPPSIEFIVWLLDLAIEQRAIDDDSESDGDVSGGMDSRSKRVEIGYSPAQELLFSVLEGASRKTRRRSLRLSCVCGLPVGGWQPLGVYDNNMQHRTQAPSILCERCFRQAIAPLATCGQVIDTGRCVVPTIQGERPASLLAVFYSNKAAKTGFKGTTGCKVNLNMLDVVSSASDLTRKNSFVNNSKANAREVIAARGKSRRSVPEGGSGRARRSRSDASSSSASSCSSPVFSLSDASSGDFEGSHQSRHRRRRSRGDDSSTRSRARKGSEEKRRDDIKRDNLMKFTALMKSGVDVVKISNTPITRHAVRTLFLDKEETRLCWLPPGRANLVPDPRHSVPVSSIKSIKIGSGKFDHCISIVAEEKTSLIKIEDDKLFSQLVEGFMLLSERNRLLTAEDISQR